MDRDPQAQVEKWADRLEHKRQFTREVWIRTMETRLVQEQLAKCYRYEGVNQKQNCKELAERYMNMLKTHKLEGELLYESDTKQ